MKKIFLVLTFIAATFIFSKEVFSLFRPPINGNLTLTTSPSRLPNFEVANCTLQAASGNSGIIYIGSSIVTNASGGNAGISLAAGAAISNISVNNSNWIYVVADTGGDVVRYLCN